jgi:hypothetical protein
MELKPKEKPSGMNQDYWDARNRVSIDIHQFFKWLNGEWDAQKIMSGQYVQYPQSCGDGCKRAESTTHASTTYVSVTDGDGARKNDCPESDGTGPVPRWTKGTCDRFNTTPSQYGKIPEEELKKRRYNVCLPTKAMAYYLTTYKRKDIGPWAVCGCPGFQPPDSSQIQPSTNTDSRTWQTSTCKQCDCGGDPPTKASIRCYWGSCRTSFYSSVSISFDAGGSWYDPETKKVYPKILISGAYPNFGWLGDHPKDTPGRGAEGKHTTSTKVTVDGVDIPCGTSWYAAGQSGNISLSIAYTVKEREL